MAPKSVTVEHKETGVSNLEVVKMMLSLKSRGFVKENFCWAHHYFYLTDAGIEYLRQYLHLPADIVPATLKKQVVAGRPEGEAKQDAPRRRDDGYRREEGTGFGRGRAL